MTTPRIIPVWTGDTSPESVTLTVPSALIDRTPAFCSLLAACGVPPETARAEGSAPDYDFFAAVIDSLPSLCGHPAARRLPRLLAALNCPPGADAPALWRCLSVRMGPDAPEPLTVSGLSDALGVPLTVPFRPDAALTGRRGLCTLTDMERVVSDGLSAGADVTLLRLPETYVFTRPNPYTSGLCLGRAVSNADGAFSWDALTAPDRDHFLTQLVRMTGGLCRRAGRVLHIAGTGVQLDAVTAYLSEAGCLPDTVRLLTDPAASGDPLQPFPGVRTGLWLPGSASTADLRASVTAYAERMPLGCADGLYVGVRTPMELTQPDEVRRVTEELLALWSRGTI
ncbi:MAG: hypothetical protein MJ192_10345 [Clostridia bacterium]|nr:hypothetical protein [Clostridia bacterium]